ncbi:hypothetical protein FRC20_007730, partial [Serendipita sp. 405]
PCGLVTIVFRLPSWYSTPSQNAERCSPGCGDWVWRRFWCMEGKASTNREGV